MKNILKTTILALVLAAFTSCSDPLDRVYNEETIEEDLKALVSQDKIRTHEEMENLYDYIQLLKALDVSLDSVTYRQLLEEANEITEE